MKKGGVVLLLVLVALMADVSAETLTVATYNVENYLAADRMVEGKYREQYPKPESEKRALRAVIAAVNADVIALEEMGARPYLTELQRDLAAEGAKYPYAEWMEAGDKDRHVAVLSKRPLVDVQKHADLTFEYSGKPEEAKRGMLEVKVGTEGGVLTLFIIHLKSRFTDREDDQNSALRRLKEAEAIRDRVMKVAPEPESRRYLILGDCNDSASSKPLKALQRKGSKVVAEILSAADSRGEVWTHYYRKDQTYSAVDHILVSPALKKAVVGGSALICDVRETGEASDHRPLVVKLELTGTGGK